MGKTKLEELADVYRVENVIKNTYLNSDGKTYGATHPNAISDGDGKGRGTNGTSDLLNTVDGGNDIDINGNPEFPGSGRRQLIAKNESKYGSTTGPNGYGPSKPYFPNYILNNNNTPEI
jgi:hypothetical protein